MLSAWWLCLIIPLSAFLGYIACGILMAGSAMDEFDIDKE